VYKTNKHYPPVFVFFALLFTLTLGFLAPLNRSASAQSKSGSLNNAVWTVEKTAPGEKENEISTPNAPLIAPVDRAWTTVGSAGTIDEDSLAIARVQNFTLNFLPSATGTITVRYNITATDGMTSFCPGTFAMVRMRYRNSDPTGMTSKYSWELHSSNISTGGNTTLVTFASTISSSFSNGAAFLTVTGTLGSVDFDFANNVYWLEAKIFRSDPAQFSDIGPFQFWESAGTPCP